LAGVQGGGQAVVVVIDQGDGHALGGQSDGKFTAEVTAGSGDDGWMPGAPGRGLGTR